MARGWTVRATEPDWINLADWVDWLVPAYHLRPARTVLPCWPAHPGVTEELAARHSAWAVAAAQDAPGDAMVLWHDRIAAPNPEPTARGLPAARLHRHPHRPHLRDRQHHPARARRHARGAPPSGVTVSRPVTRRRSSRSSNRDHRQRCARRRGRGRADDGADVRHYSDRV